MFDDCSHRIEVVVMLVTFFLFFATTDYAYHWLTAAIISGICLIVDFMFFQPDLFIFDPDYHHWKDITEKEEFDIKQE